MAAGSRSLPIVTKCKTRIPRDVRTFVSLPLQTSEAGCSNVTPGTSSPIPGDDPRDEEESG